MAHEESLDLSSNPIAISTEGLKKHAGEVAKKAEKFIPKDYPITNEYDSPKKYSLRAPHGFEHLKPQFEYLASTKDLEIGTPRVNILQNIANEMLDGLNKKVRLVIANKGTHPAGFVFPEGTLVINQALLNKLDSLDEVAGVIAHEIGHLVLETHRYNDTFEVAWVHEAWNDAREALKLMEKAGFNTLAHADALGKISDGHRDHEHMTGETRGATVVASHAAVHYLTSSKEVKPLDEIFHKTVVNPTNNEILKDVLEREDLVNFKKLLPKLHRKDLWNLRVTRKPEAFNQAFEELEMQRLDQSEFSEESRNIFRPKRIRDEEALLSAVTALPQYEEDNTEDKIWDYLYLYKVQHRKKGETTQRMKKNVSDIMETIHKEHGKNPDFMHISSDTFLSIMDQFNQSPYIKEVYGTEKSKASAFTLFMNEYVGNIMIGHISELDGVELDLDQVRSFYQSVKDSGIPIDNDEMWTDTRFWARYTHSSEFQEQLQQTFEEVFGKKVEEKYVRPEFDFSRIDTFFDEHRENIPSQDYAEFIKDIYEFFDKVGAEDTERLRYIDHIYNRLGQQQLSSSVDLLKQLEDPSGTSEVVGEDQDLNSRLMRMNLRMLAGYTLFSRNQFQGNNAFYTYMQKTMDECGMTSQQFSDSQLFNLCQGFFVTGEHMREPKPQQRKLMFLGESGIEILPLEKSSVSMSTSKTLELPFVRDLAERSASVQLDSLEAVHDYYKNTFVANYSRWSSLNTPKIFGSDLYSVVMGRGLRESFSKHIAQPISAENLLEMRGIINLHFPESVTKAAVLAKFDSQYLESDQFSFEDKTNYLLGNMETLGYEGVMTLSEQIHTYPQFVEFDRKLGGRMRQELAGSDALKTVAAAEILTAEFVKDFEQLFGTTRKGLAKDVTTDFSRKWFEHYDRRGDIMGVHYDQETGNYSVDQRGIDLFKTVADMFEELKAMPAEKRFMAVQKALTDRDGALTSEENRKKLGQIAVDALELSKGSFTAKVLDATCQVIDPKYGSFSIAKMMSPILFSSYDVKTADINKLLGVDVWIHLPEGGAKRVPLRKIMSPEQLTRILQSETTDIVEPGNEFLAKSDSYASFLNRESNTYYRRSRDAVAEAYLSPSSVDNERSETDIDPGTDAVLTGLATLGAPVTRGFQFSRQLYDFSPAMNRRLDRFFDQNPGLNNFFFWENLHTLAQSDAGLKEVLEQQLVSLDETVGVGSLYTTKAATVRDEDGETRKIVIKLLNPNAEAFVDKVYSESQVLFDRIEKGGTRAERKYMSVARAAAKLSHEWCKRDINDSTFLEDDKTVQSSIEVLNAQSQDSGVTYEVPKTYYYSREIKMEDFQDGTTLNKFLNDESVSEEQKRKAVLGYTKLYYSQFEKLDGDPDSDTRHLILSNPSVGNCMVISEGDHMRFGIIDRNLYLSMEREDAEVFKTLIDGNYSQFVKDLIDRMFETKGRKGFGGRIDRSRVMFDIGREVAKQRLRGEQDNLGAFRTVLNGLQSRGIEVPLEYRLTVGNIESMKKLCQQFGITSAELKAA